MSTQGPGPLAGVRIVELATVVMAPLATRALADMGADVIRVEAPGGDFMRDFDPKRNPKMGGFSMGVNRNKKSVVLDLKTPEGHSALCDLVATANAFVTNIRPRALQKLNVTDEDLRTHRPDLVYCSATGFGSDGPYADKAAYDDVIQAASGFASMFTWFDDEPRFVPTIIADKVAAMHIAYAVLAGLYRQRDTGEGDFIEVPMGETMVAFNLVEHLSGHTFDPPEGDFSYLRLRTKHRRPRRSADGWVCILPYSDRNWVDFFKIAGLDEHANDPRFATVNARITNVNALYALLDEAVGKRTTAEWMELCDEHSIPAVPVVDLEHVEDDPHYAAVEMIEYRQHPTEGAYRNVKHPIQFRSGSPGLYQPAAGLGEHTSDVFRSLGYNDEQLAQLEAQNHQP